MKNWVLKNKWLFLAASVGAIAGYFYWQQVGCSSGTCAITSNPVNSTLYGALLGWIVGGLFKPTPKREGQDERL